MDKTGGLHSMSSSPGPITNLLSKFKPRNRDSASELLAAVYQDLRQIASALMRRERPGHILQTTALVHEAFMRLMKDENTEWKDSDHFFSAAAVVTRRVLVDYARENKALKRGGNHQRVELSQDIVEGFGLPYDDLTIFISVHDALTRLAKFAPLQAKIIELRFFTGLSIAETASELEIGETKVKEQWQLARAWLLRELK